MLYVPVQKRCYFAYKNCGAFVQEAGAAAEKIQTQSIDEEHIRFLVGQYHRSKRMDSVLSRISGSELLRVNSSLKFGWLAEGRADVYPRFGSISEWDIAAGHCILSEAGGKIVDFKGESLQYNAQESLICPSFLAVGDAAPVDRLIQIFEENAS